ncbi:MAG TPA: AMP-binding protein, partial [Methylomirabilota bacterium]|nr:AMP-binding protein [Methylomirabilota bacterium]
MHAGHFLTRAALRFPDRPAWLQGDLTVTFREAEARVNRLAQALLTLGGQPGDRVGMLLPNGYQGLETLLAPMKAGMAVVPMNIRLHPSEHEYMLNDSGAFALIYGEEFRDHLGQIRGNLTSIKHFISVGRGAAGDLAYDQVLDGQPETPPDPAIEADDL